MDRYNRRKGGLTMNIHELLTEAQLQDTLIGTLGIEFKELEKERVVCTMPVTPKTHQPFGILHGGASVALAETAASIAAFLNVNPETHYPVGLEINANHMRAKRDGIVTAIATPFHIGRTTMVWQVEIKDEQDRLVCVSRCTVAVVAK